MRMRPKDRGAGEPGPGQPRNGRSTRITGIDSWQLMHGIGAAQEPCGNYYTAG
jgi:hypothetical protein